MVKRGVGRRGLFWLFSCLQLGWRLCACTRASDYLEYLLVLVRLVLDRKDLVKQDTEVAALDSLRNDLRKKRGMFLDYSSSILFVVTALEEGAGGQARHRTSAEGGRGRQGCGDECESVEETTKGLSEEFVLNRSKRPHHSMLASSPVCQVCFCRR